MPSIKKTASGKWHALVYDYTDEQGKRHYKSITADTKARCELLSAEFKLNRADRPKIGQMTTVGDVVDKYINLRRSVLAKTTIARYEQMRKFSFPDLMAMNVADVNKIICQEAINKEILRPNAQNGRPLAAKTIKEEWHLIKTSMKHICDFAPDCVVPKEKSKIVTLPDSRLVDEVITGLRTELACRLAFEMGLRMSEVRGLEYKHIKNDMIHIIQTKKKIRGVDVVEEYTKTSLSCRQVPITPNVMRLLKQCDAWKNKEGFIVPQSPESLYDSIHTAMKKRGEDMSFHDLRHEFASVCINILHIPVVCVQMLGGWSDSTTLYKRYVNNMDSIYKESVKTIANYFKDLR